MNDPNRGTHSLPKPARMTATNSLEISVEESSVKSIAIAVAARRNSRFSVASKLFSRLVLVCFVLLRSPHGSHRRV